ncbi:CELLULOSE SYNTHASE-LIKE PROTEIN G2 [Salix koriyanagi]|uniref:CELLULOSE SYNTHASE-LIKE PROTEIN G2 n=1 Tax=Salix koriyanagi TaxID=2511006 RepID=A0A9Q1AHH5_9ROSI|nr:CELLULOSE SYNTHASE-LIKE PROTEIN G2 [Salix koriyanagi]
MRFREDFVLEETKSKIKGRDHPALVEVVQDNSNEEATKDEANEMPLLTFLARRGLLILTIPRLRVSGVISNSPYILVLDRGHVLQNDPTSARQAMCFYFDPISLPR